MKLGKFAIYGHWGFLDVMVTDSSVCGMGLGRRNSRELNITTENVRF